MFFLYEDSGDEVERLLVNLSGRQLRETKKNHLKKRRKKLNKTPEQKNNQKKKSNKVSMQTE